jgi:hypothetical protein
MVGIITQELPGDDSLYGPNGYQQVERPWIEGIAASAAESWNTTAIAPQAWRWADRQINNTSSPKLSPEDANAKYGIDGVLQFDEPVTDEVAAERKGLVQDQIQRQSVIDRSGVGFIGRTLSSIAGAAADPVNIAAAVAPEMLLGKLGAAPAAGAALSERVIYGAASGALGNALLTPAQAFFAGDEGRQYSLGDALMDITIGGAIGASVPIAGSVLGKMRDRYYRDATSVRDAIEGARVDARRIDEDNAVRTMNASPENSLETLTNTLQQKMQGLPVDVSATVDQTDIRSRVLANVDNAVDQAASRAANTIRTATDSMMHTGEIVAAGPGDMSVAWQKSRAGTVAAADMERLSPITRAMAPVEQTADSMTWRAARPEDGKIVEYKLTETEDGKPRWDVQVVPKRSKLSKFVDKNAPADLQATFATERADVDTDTPQSQAREGGDITDPNDALRTQAGKTFRAGEQQPTSALTRPITQDPSIGDPRQAADLHEMQQQIDEAPSAPVRARAEGQVLGESTAAVNEMEQFAAEDNAVLDELRKQGRLSKQDEDGFAQLDGVGKRYKEVATARQQAITCLAINGAGYGE